MDQWRYRSSRGTYILLAASFLLIGPTVVGLGATLPLLAAYVGIAALAWAGREGLRGLPVVAGYDLGWYARDSWLAALFAGVASLAVFGAPPPELQAAGGILGLVGMVNYFLRPLYLLIADVLVGLVRGR
jgi:hypothetical protein